MKSCNKILIEIYIKRCIMIAEQHTNSNNILKDITNKFPSEYALPHGFAGRAAGALAPDRQAAFWERYNTDEAFRKQMNSSCAYNKQDWFDFLQNSDELRKYLKPELKSAEIILVEQDEASALRISDVRSALEIAENVEEFEEMVRASV